MLPENHHSLLDLAPVIPVVVIDDLDHAVPMAHALVRGGLPVIEVTLRTPAALEAITAIAKNVSQAIVGAGTVTTTGRVRDALNAGAQFLVSPGTTESLLDAMQECGVPFLPGTATPSDVMRLLERGITEMKFFPAEASGGRAMLKSLASPLPEARFCPTGGITPETAPLYRELPNVGCVGGTWLTPSGAMAAGDWSRIEALAAAAAG